MSHRAVEPRTRHFAKAMRREMTGAELRLWRRLRKPGIEGLRFRRQIPMGPYIVDFFCPEKKLIVELDGDHHGLPEGERKDATRDLWLKERGYVVVRFWNGEVLSNLNGVCDTILAAAIGQATDIETRR
jgi:very-short-patch-repair endonuclease